MKLPGVYAVEAKTNSSERRVPLLGTGLIFLPSRKGLVGVPDLCMSQKEFTTKYGTLDEALDLKAHRACLAFLESGNALYVVRVTNAQTAAKAFLKVDEGDAGTQPGGEVVDPGTSPNRWLMTDEGDDWQIDGAGAYIPSPESFVAAYNAGTNTSRVIIRLKPASAFVAAQKLQIRAVHNAGFPIQLVITDDLGATYSTTGYVSNAALDLRLQSLSFTGEWQLNFFVFGNLQFSVSDIQLFIAGADADIIEGL